METKFFTDKYEFCIDVVGVMQEAKAPLEVVLAALGDGLHQPTMCVVDTARDNMHVFSWDNDGHLRERGLVDTFATREELRGQVRKWQKEIKEGEHHVFLLSPGCKRDNPDEKGWVFSPETAEPLGQFLEGV